MPEIEQVIGEWRGRASALQATGHAHDAQLVERVLDDVAGALTEYLAWMGEAEAMLYEGRTTPDGLRARFAELEARGLAKWDERQRTRWYRRIALRHRGCPEAARAAGRRAGAA